MSAAENSKKGFFTRKEKKELTPSQRKWRTALNWIVNIVCIVIIVFSLVVAVVNIVRTTNDQGIANFFGTAFMPVKSGSMSPTFEKGDLILSKVYEGNGSDLKVGQVVTFKMTRNVGGSLVEDLNTHRIIRIDGALIYTKGDNPNAAPDSAITADKIVAVWGSVDENGNAVDGKIWKGMGKLSNWLQDGDKGKTRFFCIIVLPLILLFVGYAVVLIRALVINKIEKQNAQAAPITADSLSEEDKRRLAEEYLASLRAYAKDGSQNEADGDAAGESVKSGDNAPSDGGEVQP